MKKDAWKKVLMSAAIGLPFIIGTIGYLRLGCSLTDAMYASVSLYLMNIAEEGKNIFVELARWLAPLVLASGILMAIRQVFERVRNGFACMYGDSTAVYGDNDYARELAGSMKHGFFAGGELSLKAREHIIYFENDMDNFHFYERNRKILENKKVYMKLEEMDSFLLNKSRVRYFNLPEIIARQYWKQYHLISQVQRKKEIQIALIGFGQMGQSLLKYSLLNNIYDRDQKITYHIWGDSHTYQKLHEGMDLMNGDRLVFHQESFVEDWKLLKEMERVILADDTAVTDLEVCLSVCQEQELHVYDPRGEFSPEVYIYENLVTFGRWSGVTTQEMIKTDRLYRLAKELNYRYFCLYRNGGKETDDKEACMEAQWEALDGFTKGSNISSADYHEIRRILRKNRGAGDLESMREEISFGEHVRWARYHYLNFWSYGIPENGKNKDPGKKLHKCLVPYDELPKEEQEKDFEAAKLLFELMP